MGTGTAAPRPRLEIRSLSKTFASARVLTNLNLTIAPGEIHGLVGENGSGKSTCIKIIAGFHRADPGGAVLIDGAVLAPGDPAAPHDFGVRFVHQDLGLIDGLSVADNLLLGDRYPLRFATIRGRELRSQAASSLRRIGLDLDPSTPVGALTPAVRTGVAIARALGREGAIQPKLLVMDEPTASLPSHEADALIGILKAVAATGVSVLYVTHRLDELFVLTDQLTVLRDGVTVAQRPTSTLDRAALVELLVGTELEETSAAASATPGTGGEDRLKVESLRAGPLRDVSFVAGEREVLGIAGIAGSGREQLLGAVFGAQKVDAGRVWLDGCQMVPGRPDRSIAAGMAMLPADRKRLGGLMDMSGRENLVIADVPAFWHFPTLRRAEERAEATRWWDRLAVRPAGSSEAPLRTFSGGNQQKILMAKWLRRAPKVLLVDEPTQGVDIGAKARIHQELLHSAEAGTTVVVASSELEELVALCHRVLVLREGRLAAEIPRTQLTVAALRAHVLGLAEVAA